MNAYRNLQDGDFISTLRIAPSPPKLNKLRDYPQRKAGNKTSDILLRIMVKGTWYTVQDLADLCERTVSMTRNALKWELTEQVLSMRSSRKNVCEYVWRLK